MFKDSKVWDDIDTLGTSTMDLRAFMIVMTASIMFGIVTTLVAANYARDLEFGLWGFLGLFLLSLVGIFVTHATQNPLISFFGYSLVAVPLGLFLGPALAEYSAFDIIRSFIMTSAVVMAMGIIGMFIPQSLERFDLPIIGALLALIGGYFLLPFANVFGLQFEVALGWLDWAAILLFSGITIRDFNRAVRVRRTFSNAISCGMSVYLNWLNIFIRIARRLRR